MCSNQLAVICFGEILWDLLPSGKLPGGAPMNVAYHLHKQGTSVKMISRIGQDELGSELLEVLANRGIATDTIQIDANHPTGIVQVTLDAAGTPSYSIVQPVAWDFIEAKEHIQLVSSAGTLVYGSLAARNPVSQQTLALFLEVANYKVFDINLRPPFYNQSTIAFLLQAADLVKMNEEELAILTTWYNTGQLSETDQLEQVQKHFELEGIILTKGAAGALFYQNGQVFQQPIFKVQVADTIGSGDAFLAGFLHKYLQKQPIQDCLRNAAKLGAYVASKKGAMPDYNR